MQTSYAVAIALLVVCCSSPARADDNRATIVGSETAVRFERKPSTLLLHVKETAGAFGWQAKIVGEGGLLTLCRDGDGGVCIPVRLDRVESLGAGDALHVDATVLGRVLRFSVEDRDGRVVLQADAHKPAGDGDLPAYNAQWGAGRGFQVGQTLPDIPLYDMDGREVRFSRFLGKQFILYCWASW